MSFMCRCVAVGIKSGFQEGPVTQETVVQVIGNDNVIVSFEMKGIALRTAIDHIHKPPANKRDFQFSGINYAPCRAAVVGSDGTSIPEQLQPFQIWVLGEPLDDEAWYRVATLDYLCTTVFAKGAYIEDLEHADVIRNVVPVHPSWQGALGDFIERNLAGEMSDVSLAYLHPL
jgi:2',3'-cyclic-nucleotide 2'-phosphodiesterase (5'-nucleotidase family)